LLEGLSEEVLQTVAENLPITKGAHRLMKALKYYGYKTTILWGFTFFWKPCKKNWESIMCMLMNLKLSMEINR
jgi:phosphoserine phosphatase